MTPVFDVEGVRISRSGSVALLQVDRPSARNALSPPTMDALAVAVASLRDDPPRALVLAGGGGTFIAGGDLRALHALDTAEAGAAMCRRMNAVLEVLEALPCPVIAALQGHTLGGGVEVALAADLRVAEPSARIGFRQIDFAVSTGWGGARRLAALVGPARARRLLWEGTELGSVDAQALGLVDRVAHGETALAAAMRWAADLAHRPALAVAGTKRLVREGAHLDATAYAALEAEVFGPAWASVEHTDAVRRFLARPRPQPVPRPLFVVLEGLDGAGTTTQCRLLVRWLVRRGRRVHATAEPSSGPLGNLLRQALGRRVVSRDGSRLDARSIALLFAADRVDHLRAEIEPALMGGQDVVCDRYDHSSLAYQGAETDVAWVATLNEGLRRPDLVLFLSVRAEVAGRRRARRGGTPEIYEEDEFQRRVAQGYETARRLRPDDRVVVIDGEQGVRVVQRACRAAVAALLPRADGVKVA